MGGRGHEDGSWNVLGGCEPRAQLWMSGLLPLFGLSHRMLSLASLQVKLWQPTPSGSGCKTLSRHLDVKEKSSERSFGWDIKFKILRTS